MKSVRADSDFFGSERIGKVLMHIAPPVMLAQLIQALYNIVDSYFVGKYSPDGLTALSVIFPVQLIITALAVGTGVGVNTQMARRSLIRQLGCLIPIFFVLSKIGLSYTWIAFPASGIITGAIGISLYLRQIRQWAGGVD